MAGQATHETVEQVRACIKAIEMNKGGGSKAPKSTEKNGTTSKKISY